MRVGRCERDASVGLSGGRELKKMVKKMEWNEMVWRIRKVEKKNKKIETRLKMGL